MAEKGKEISIKDYDLPSLELGKLIDLADPGQVKKFLNLHGLTLSRVYEQYMPSNEPTLPTNFARSTGDLPHGLTNDTKAEDKSENDDKQTISILLSTKNTNGLSLEGRPVNLSSNTDSSGTVFLPSDLLCQSIPPDLLCQAKGESDMNDVQWINQDNGKSIITFLDGNAVVIEEDLEVIDDESNMFGEGLPQQQQMDEKSIEPKIIVKTEGYHRFRYMSEMGSRGTKRTFENHDGKEFVSIHVKNYCGRLTVLMFCVDIDRRPHPFYLEGERCKDGLFMDTYAASQELMIRIKQINIICPTHKHYQKSLDNLKKALKYHASCHEWSKDCRDVQLKTVDKTKVRLRVEVKFENGQQSIVTFTEPIQDRKQGIDFKIHTVRDPSAPASGSLEGNPILIVTTNDTNFPKNVDVVLYDDSGWEVKADPSSVEIIKKCVVIFQAPPYTKDRDLKSNVTVNLALHDRETGKRTPPVNFLYYVDSDIYGVKSKKRKLDSLQDSSNQNPSEIRTASQANNNVLQVVKRKLGSRTRTTDAAIICADNVENAIADTLQEMPERQIILQDESKVANMPSQMQNTLELIPDELAAFLQQFEQSKGDTEVCHSEQNSVPAAIQPQHTLSKGNLSITQLPDRMLRISYKGKVVGDFSQESWCQMLQKKRHQKSSEMNTSASLANNSQHIYQQQCLNASTSASLANNSQHIYPQQYLNASTSASLGNNNQHQECLNENTSITIDSQKQNPAIYNEKTMEGLIAACNEQEAALQRLKQLISERMQHESGIIENEDHDSLGNRQFSLLPQHQTPITLTNTDDYAFNTSGDTTILTLVPLDDGKYYLQSGSHQIISDYQPLEDNDKQHYIIQDPFAVANMSLAFNQTTSPTHQMIEGQPVIVQHIQQHPTEECSPTDIEQLKQTAPWIPDFSASSTGYTSQVVQASTSNLCISSPYKTSSCQDHTYSDLSNSDLECDNKAQQGNNSIIILDDLADNDLECDTVPVPAVEVEV